jgi:phosphogluconate dehydratase
LQDGDLLRVDAISGDLEILTQGFMDRDPAVADLSGSQAGVGRELFTAFRAAVGSADTGASVFGD